MSPQNGVPPSLASIETTPLSHRTLNTISSSHPPAPTFEQSPVSIDPSSVKPSTNPSSSSKAISSKIQIPRLSAATTQLLARFAGNIRGEEQGNGNNWNTSSFNQSLNNQYIQEVDTMRASSTIIELPTAPFGYSNNTVTPEVPHHTSTPSQGNYLKPAGLIAIAPKPAGTLPSGPSVPAPAPAPLPAQPRPPVPIAKKPTPTGPTGPTAPVAPAAKRQKATGRQRQRRSITNGSKRAKRRRRGDDSDGDIIRADDTSSDESDVAPIATQTKSGRQVNRPSLYVPPASSPAVVKANGTSVDASDTTASQTAAARQSKRKRVHRKGKDNNANCIHCQRGHSPLTNAIVFCDECNSAWHQLCHDPPINAEVVTVKEKEWLCQECKPVPISIIQPTVVRSNPTLQVRPLHPRPVSIPKAEVGGEGFSTEERRGYLSTLSHATLVELLITISDRSPSIPMFPRDLKALQSSEFFFPSNISTSPAPFSSNPINVPATNSSTSTAGEDTDKQDTSTPQESLPSASSTKKRHHSESLDDESEYEEFEEHRLYPRAGNGFRLSLNTEDLDILRDDPACPTFSYTLHGPAKARAETNKSVPVWGTV